MHIAPSFTEETAMRFRPRDHERYIGGYDPEREMPDPDRRPRGPWQSEAYRDNARDSRWAYRWNPDRVEDRSDDRRRRDRERDYPPPRRFDDRDFDYGDPWYRHDRYEREHFREDFSDRDYWQRDRPGRGGRY
jgi:hypothetical protein